VATVLADFTPGMSVGHAPYKEGREKIAEWLQDKKDVQLYGASLGGAIALHVAINHRDRVGRVQAYNPPGFYPWDWKGGSLPQIDIYSQQNDLVSTMGFFPESDEVNIYRVIGSRSEGLFKAHMRAYTGCEKVTFLKSSAQYENSRWDRKILTALHILLSAILVFLPVYLIYQLYRLLILPLIQ
jgi:pimeloyl-ACP methyl ester carboxylesterase